MAPGIQFWRILGMTKRPKIRRTYWKSWEMARSLIVRRRSGA
jgi:hypothetical protein